MIDSWLMVGPGGVISFTAVVVAVVVAGVVAGGRTGGGAG